MLNSKNIKRCTSTSLFTFIALGLWTANTLNTTANGTTQVSAELMLSIDVSGSVDSTEYSLQMDGYASAFRDSNVIQQILNMPDGLAVTVQFWSSEPAPAKPWRVLTDAADAEEFATYLENLSRPSSGTTSVYGYSIGSGTNVTGAISAATDSILNNEYIGDALVIDVSGDGRSNGQQWNGPAMSDHEGHCGGGNGNVSCPGVINARNAAVNSGITVNGLPIENGSGNTITSYYDAHVKGGADGFVETASSFSNFANAATTKIYREVSTAVNGPANTPNAQPDTITTNEDTAATYNLIAGDPNNGNDGQDTDPNGDTLKVTKFTVGTDEYTFSSQVTSIQLTMSSGAELTVNDNGDVIYDPAGQFENLTEGTSLTAPDEFTYTVSDPDGNLSSATATLDINGVADNPEAADDAVTTDEDTSSVINVLANDTDVDSSASDLSVTEINGVPVSSGSVINLASGASVTVNSNNTLSYDPTNSNSLQLLNDGDTQDEVFTYTVSDELGNTDTADVTVSVTGITDTFAD